jgi:GAF domain-containing protein
METVMDIEIRKTIEAAHARAQEAKALRLARAADRGQVWNPTTVGFTSSLTEEMEELDFGPSEFRDARGRYLADFVAGASLSEADADELAAEVARHEPGLKAREIANHARRMTAKADAASTLDALMNDGSGRTLAQAREIVETLKVDPDKYKDALDRALNDFDASSIQAVNDRPKAKTIVPLPDSYQIGDDLPEITLPSSLIKVEEFMSCLYDRNYFRNTAEGTRLDDLGLPVPPSEKWLADRWHSHISKEAKNRRYFGIEYICLNSGGFLLAPNKDPKKGGRPRKVKIA